MDLQAGDEGTPEPAGDACAGKLEENRKHLDFLAGDEGTPGPAGIACAGMVECIE